MNAGCYVFSNLEVSALKLGIHVGHVDVLKTHSNQRNGIYLLVGHLFLPNSCVRPVVNLFPTLVVTGPNPFEDKLKWLPVHFVGSKDTLA